MKKNVLTLMLVLFSMSAFSEVSQLELNIRKLIADKKLKLGFMLCELQNDKCIEINADDHFPMQSVYKFPIALATLNYADKNGIALTDTMIIEERYLNNKTWSPIRKKYPEGDVELPLSEIIYETVAWSDNNGSDFLLKMIGGPDSAMCYMRNNGFENIQIRNYESEIQADWQTQFVNYTTPRAIITLLKAFYQKQLLKNEFFEFLWQVMTDTSTGSIRNYIPDCSLIARKTGSSGQNSKGVTAALNDVGIWRITSDRTLFYTIFITESTESPETNAEIIAQIARLIRHSY